MIKMNYFRPLIRKRNVTSKNVQYVLHIVIHFKAILFLLPIDTILDVLGVIGATINEELLCESITSRLAIISGTSTCHIAVCY